MKPIGIIETPFKEKFGVPRQSLLSPSAWGKIRFPKNDFNNEAFRGIESFSHLWLIFEFHLIPAGELNALVRPPRFEGKEKWGVYATRSPHRPNRLGLSVVQFSHLEVLKNEIILHLKGVDLVSDTPIYDIKPYIPYADSHPQALAPAFSQKPESLAVRWKASQENLSEDEIKLITEIVALDPRPGHQRGENSEYAMEVLGLNVRFNQEEGTFVILEVKRV